MSLNIPSSVDDPNYRYKMPKLRAKIEGKGNGIRTNIYNMGDIARALKRSPEYVTKFCGHELGSQSKFEPSEGKAIVNGAHTESDLQVLIDKFCEKFVLCPNCHLPEIDFVIKTRMRFACNACGCAGDLDNAHKLATYIMKNPPAGVESTMGKKTKRTKEERQKEKSGKGQKDGSLSEDLESEKKEKKHSKKEKEEGGKEKKKEKKPKEGKTSKGGDGAVGSELPEDEGEGAELKEHHHKHKHHKSSRSKGADSSDENASSAAEKERKEKKEKKRKAKEEEKTQLLAREGLAVDSEEVDTIIKRLIVCLRGNKAQPSSELFVIPPTEFFQEVRLLQVSQEFNSRIRAYVAFASLFPLKIDAAAVKLRMPYLNAVLDRSVEGKDRCTALVEYFNRIGNASLDQSSFVFNELYQNDVLEEEDINAFFNPESGEIDESIKAVREANANFLEWLAKAESDESSDNSNDESSDEVSSHNNGPTLAPSKAPAAAAAAPIIPGQKFKSLGAVTSSMGKTTSDEGSNGSAGDIKKVDHDDAVENDDSDIDVDDL